MQLSRFFGYTALLAAFLPAHGHAQQQGQTLGQEIIQEYNRDTTDPDLVQDVNRLLEDRTGQYRLPPQTTEVLRGVPADGLKPKERFLSPQYDVDIERGDHKSSVFDDFEPLEKNVNRRGDVDFNMESRLPDENIPQYTQDAYRAVEAGQFEAAAALYKRVLYEDPENIDALFGLANAYQKSGQLDQARSAYAKLLSIQPDNWPAMNNFLVIASQEAPDHAIQEFQRLMQSNPEFSPIPAQIGMIYFSQQKYDKAAEYLQKAIVLEPDNLSYRFNLAVVYDKVGRPRQAARLYQQLLEAAAQGKELPSSTQKIQERLTYLRSSNEAWN